LHSDRYTAEVEAAEAEVHAQGIHAVPAIVVNQRHLIQGGQSVEVFERLLRQAMDEAQPA
ncbi:MAG: DsbA family oxidoreductase, partial [Roseateles sp.]